MKRHNTMGIRQYIVNNLLWGCVAGILFWQLCMAYFSLPGADILFSRRESLLLLALLQTAGVTLGCLFTLWARRNYISLISNVTLPLGLYSLCVLLREAAWLPILVMGAAAVLCGAYVWLIFQPELPGGDEGERAVRRRKQQSMHGSRVICSGCMLVLIAALFCNNTLNVSLTSSGQMVGAMAVSDKSDILQMRVKDLLLLDDEQWSDAPVSDKLEVLNTVARMEAEYLGTAPVQVYGAYMQADTQGKYDPKYEKIYINLQIISSHYSSQALRTVLHEMYHHYQHTLCDMYEDLPPQYHDLQMFAMVQQYREEFENYNDGGGDYEGYYDQLVERSARDYAEAEAVEYYEVLQQYEEEMQ